MQNIFENKKQKNSVKFVAVLLAVIAVTAVALSVNTRNKSYAQHENTAKSMYLSTSFAQTKAETGTTVEFQPEMTAEMNNEPSKNSKFYNSGHTSQSFDGLDTTKVKVLFPDGGVKDMELEDYILGCVLGEMPLDFELQALMAQSVAVRSFTVRRMLYGTPKHTNADVCTDFNCCQCYKTPQSVKLSDEKYNKLINAVGMTRGIVALYDGQPIEAAYHASSGYYTQNSEDVWGGEVPYLKSVAAPEGEAEICAKTYSFSYEKMSNLLSDINGKAVSCGAFGEKTDVTQSEYNLTTSISADGVEFDKDQIKRALGLNSTQFDIDFGETNVTVTCYGYGHGVGMSQHGANLLAKDGFGYTEILRYYYSGISLGFI